MIAEKAMAWNLRERKLNKCHQIISCSVVEQNLENKVQAKKIFVGPNHEMNFPILEEHIILFKYILS